jgi:hypothetical protein
MALSPYLVAKNACQRHHSQTQDDVACDIDSGEKRLLVAPKVHRLIAERGERCESAQKADKHKSTRLRRERAASFCQLCEQSDNQAAENVNGERPNGTIVALGSVLHQPAKEEAKNGADKVAKADPENGAHADSS